MSNIDPKHIALFEDYLNGDVQGDGLTDFHQRLKDDPEFSASFESYRKLQVGLQEVYVDGLKERLQSLDINMPEYSEPSTSSKTGRVRLFLFSAAAILVVLLVGKNMLSESRWIDDYWEDEIGLPVKMSSTSKWDDAMNALKTNNLKEARQQLNLFNSDTATYFLAHVAFEEGNRGEALTLFQSLPLESSWSNEAMFREAILLLDAGDEEKAIELLEALSKESNFKSAQIQEIIDLIN